MGQRVGDDYKKGVESTSYLRLVESRKFIIYRTVRQWPMSMGLYIFGSDALNVSNQTDYFIIPFPIYIQRGLRHCLSSVDGRCESLTSGMSDEFRFPRFLFSVFIVNAGSGILGDRKCDEWALV